MAEPEPEENRGRANLVLLLGFVAIIGIGIWLVEAMLEARKADECMSAGRRNCNPIEVVPPPR